MDFVSAMAIVQSGGAVTRSDRYEGTRTINGTTDSVDQMVLISDYIATDWTQI